MAVKETLKSKIDKMVDLYSSIQKQYIGQASMIKQFAALIYTQKDREFSKKRIDDAMNTIKKNTGIFSPYRGTSMFLLGMLLCSQYDNPDEVIMKMMGYHEKFRENGFKNSQYLPIANYALVLTCEDSLVDSRIKKAYDIYSEMKSNHPWLTSGDDYPLCILLAEHNNSIKVIEDYYTMLNQRGLSKSNGLQLLSHILSFSSEDIVTTSDRCKAVYDRLKENKLKLYSSYYGALGLITLLDDEGNEIVDDLIEAAHYINGLKKYKWNGKGLNIILASALVSDEYIKEKSSNSSLLDTTISVTLETLISAQTSAILAGTIAASTAATSTN